MAICFAHGRVQRIPRASRLSQKSSLMSSDRLEKWYRTLFTPRSLATTRQPSLWMRPRTKGSWHGAPRDAGESTHLGIVKPDREQGESNGDVVLVMQRPNVCSGHSE